MAKFRQVHTTFWQDPRVLEEMTPEDKYFYLYLLTNPNTTQIGVYQITRKQMAFDLGYSTESINSLLERFINMHKVVKYNDQTREIAIINWGKYNLNKAGKPVIDCVKKELAGVKDKTLLWEVMNHIPNNAVTTEFSRYVYDTSTTRGQEKEQEEEVEQEEEQQQEENVYNFYQNNFGVLSPFISEKMTKWVDDVGQPLVIESMKRALAQQKKFNYAEGILKRWQNENIKSLDDVKAYDEQFNRNKGGGQSAKAREAEQLANEYDFNF